MGRKHNIFIAHSMYNILLATGMAKLLYPHEKNWLIGAYYFDDASIFIEEIKKEGAFESIMELATNYKHRYKRVYNCRKNITFLKFLFSQIIKQENEIRILTFNDGLPEDQYLLFQNYQISPENNIYVEDGVGIYSLKFYKPDPIKERLGKILFGKWYQEIPHHGANKYTKKIVSFLPGLVPLTKKKLKIDKTILQNSLSPDRVKSLLIKHSINPDKIHEPGMLIVLPHSEFKYSAQSYKYFHEQIKKANSDNILLKLHPRENSEEIITKILKIDSKKVNVLPKETPLEAVYIYWHINNIYPQTILGDISTALYTARLILGNKTDIISVMPLGYDKGIENVFKRLDIKIKPINP